LSYLEQLPTMQHMVLTRFYAKGTSRRYWVWAYVTTPISDAYLPPVQP
jgi:hypothetical protein